MSEESVVRDLFDRWERVWHEGRYDLVAECVAQVYTRHDESGTRRVTPEEYAAEVAAARREWPNTRFVVYDHEIAGDRAWFRWTLMWTDRAPARLALARACSSTGSREASSRRLGSRRWASW